MWRRPGTQSFFPSPAPQTINIDILLDRWDAPNPVAPRLGTPRHRISSPAPRELGGTQRQFGFFKPTPNPGKSRQARPKTIKENSWFSFSDSRLFNGLRRPLRPFFFLDRIRRFKVSGVLRRRKLLIAIGIVFLSLRHTACNWRGRMQRLIQVFDDVLRVFDSDAEPNGFGAYACAKLLVAGHLAMGRGSRMAT